MNNSLRFKIWEISRRLLLIAVAGFVVYLIVRKNSSPILLYLGTAICVVCAGVWLYTIFAGLTYLSYENDGNVLIFKYYKAEVFNNSRKKIIIPCSGLVKASIKRNGLKKELSLLQMTENGPARYEPVNVTFFSVASLERMTEELDRLSSENG